LSKRAARFLSRSSGWKSASGRDQRGVLRVRGRFREEEIALHEIGDATVGLKAEKRVADITPVSSGWKAKGTKYVLA